MGHSHSISECISSSPTSAPDLSILLRDKLGDSGGGLSSKVPATYMGRDVGAGLSVQLSPACLMHLEESNR